MQRSVRPFLLAASIALLAEPATARDGVYLPAAPRGSGGEDSIETAGGTRCRQSLNSSGAYLDVGAAAQASSGTPDRQVPLYIDEPESEGVIYARITMPLGKRPSRLDCSRLYELEIARLERELELLRLAAE